MMTTTGRTAIDSTLLNPSKYFPSYSSERLPLGGHYKLKMAKPERATATEAKPKLSILTKKKDKIKLKSVAFRSKLNVAHAERTKKKSHARKDSKGKRRKKHALDFASFERTLEGLGKQYGGDGNALRMKDVTVTSSKQRERVVKEERGRMEAVLHHPVFKEDPFKAVMGHLAATLGVGDGARHDSMEPSP